jgi:hypothetical protein
MTEQLRPIVRKAVDKILQETASTAKIEQLTNIHSAKVHFVPIRYRIIGGLLQSLNIKFGNFIEKLIALVIEQDVQVQAQPESGKRLRLSTTPETDTLIDQYITRRQLPDSADLCDDEYDALTKSIFRLERISSLPKQIITKDVDVLFQSRDGKFVYLEVKYNDDHDTGKFVDINRKFLKTYAGLLNYLDINSIEQLSPFIYYFNPTKRYSPIYVPSSTILRGSQLFERFLGFSYSEIDTILRTLGDDEDIIGIFDRLYHKIRYEISVEGKKPNG